MKNSKRYARQRDTFSCGPTAIVNAIKWAGYSCPAREFKKIFKKRTGCTRLRGTDPWILEQTLKRVPELSIQYVLNVPNLRDIDEELKKGRSVLLRYFHSHGGHYTLIVGRTKKFYVVVNDSPKKAISYRSRKKMKKLINNSVVAAGEFCYAVAWSLESA